MRVLQYNILNGCQGDPDRLNRLGAWLKRQAYDVVGLNELNGWDQQPDIQELGAAWEYPYTELFVTPGAPHFLGVLSKHPIELVETCRTAPEVTFDHGVLHVRILGVHYMVTHLTPVDSANREKETGVLAKMAGAVAAPLALMGDMNTLSPADREEHESSGLAESLRRDAALTRKFLNGDGGVNYKPFEQLTDSGLRDLRAGVGGAYSVPTPSNRDRAHSVQMRLDYILANHAFIKRYPEARSRIIHSEEVASLSDHYPVECAWAERINSPSPIGPELEDDAS